VPACQLKFQPIAVYGSYCGDYPMLPVVADFNGDNRLDLNLFCQDNNSINVLLGNGNGTFKIQTTVLPGNINYTSGSAVGDFNNDSQLDLIFTNPPASLVYVLLGNGNGTFELLTVFSTGYGIETQGITVADFNGDSYLDAAIVYHTNNSIAIFLGNGNGTFSALTTFWTGRNSYPTSLAVAYLNNDHYLDIVVSNYFSKSAGVFLGHGDGTFEVVQNYFAGGGNVNPFFTAIGDFNGDTRPDVVIGYDQQNMITVLFTYDNGSLGERARFSVGAATVGHIAVGDLNNDGHSDIVVAESLIAGVFVLFGDGNGSFNGQTIFLTNVFSSYFIEVAVGDFNDDGCQDVVITDAGYGSA